MISAVIGKDLETECKAQFNCDFGNDVGADFKEFLQRPGSQSKWNRLHSNGVLDPNTHRKLI